MRGMGNSVRYELTEEFNEEIGHYKKPCLHRDDPEYIYGDPGIEEREKHHYRIEAP